jgi:uncharacterized protein YndB with AHSA1/START domain
MNLKLVARQSVIIVAPLDAVWDALVNSAVIKKYMFGADVVSDWKEGSPIIFKGVWQGKPYEDKGRILKFIPGRLIQYSHYSPLSGQPDIPENYHTVTMEVSRLDTGTGLALSQDNNATQEEKEHSEENWGFMLQGIKKLLEKR